MTNILLILKIIAAILTIATGLYALIKPRSLKGFTGLDVTGSRGITELRAVMGGVFIALGISPFIIPNPQVYIVLGIVYLVIASIRAASMVLDKSIERSNVISLVVEVLLGIILIA